MSSTPNLPYIAKDLRALARPLSDLTLDPANARVHPQRNRDVLRASLREFGQRRPAVVRRDGMLVEAGNCMLEVAQELGWTHLAVIVEDDDENRARAYGLVDNRSAELAEWDPDLADHLVELRDDGINLEHLGWSDDELETLIADLETSQDGPQSDETGTGSPLTDADDEVPEPPAEPVTRLGDVVELGRHVLHCGDCLDVMRGLADDSIDAVVTDPPYGLSPDGKARTWDDIEAGRVRGGFMGKAWDAACPGITWAREALRVLKPGGHIVAFGATRTVHRLTCALEDAGFEIRDQIGWQQYHGFPKSLNVSETLRHQDGVCACQHSHDGHLFSLRSSVQQSSKSRIASKESDVQPIMRGDAAGASAREASKARGRMDTGAPGESSPPFRGDIESFVEGRRDDEASQRELQGNSVRPMPAGASVDGAERRLCDGAPPCDGKDDRSSARSRGSGSSRRPRSSEQRPVESGAVAQQRESQASRAWNSCEICGMPMVPEGLGTALKPALEPAVLARKPLDGTVAENVLRWGTGALNIDACRIPEGDPAWPGPQDIGWSGNATWIREGSARRVLGDFATDGTNALMLAHQRGRWPANVYACPKPARSEREAGCEDLEPVRREDVTGRRPGSAGQGHPRSSTRRAGDILNPHPTIKPVRLMRWLLQLVSPPGATVLEPFAGSGSTLVAARDLDLRIVAAELEPSYCDIVRARLGELPSVQ